MVTTPGIAGKIYRSRAWKDLARQVVAEEPICWLQLPGCKHRSRTADHIIPIPVRPDLALTRSNCRGACNPCNALRKATPISQLAELRLGRNTALTRPEALARITAAGKTRRAPSPALQIFR